MALAIAPNRRGFSWRSNSFALKAGEPKFYEKISDTERPMLRGFCGQCGSALIIKASYRPKVVFIHAASLENRSWHSPMMDIFTDSAVPWGAMDVELDKCGGPPPVPDSLGR